jgi:hypothetical protein
MSFFTRASHFAQRISLITIFSPHSGQLIILFGIFAFLPRAELNYAA